jgi:AcrR family transcriptional regulator
MQRDHSTDPRAMRTRRQVIEAILAIATSEDVAGISVESIAGRAGINRTTFYRHFRDRDEAVREALDALFAELTAEDRKFVLDRPHLSPDVVPAGIVAQLLHIAGAAPLYRRLLGSTGSAAFAARLRTYHEDQFLQLWVDQGLTALPGSAPVEFRARLASGAFQNVISWWLEDGQHIPAESIATWLWEGLRALWFDPDTVLTSPANLT